MVYQLRESQQQVGFWTIWKDVWQVDQGQLVYQIFSNEGVFFKIKSVRKIIICQLFFWRSTPMIWLIVLLILVSWKFWEFYLGRFFFVKTIFLPNFFLLWSLDHKIGSRLIPQKWPFLWTCALRWCLLCICWHKSTRESKTGSNFLYYLR